MHGYPETKRIWWRNIEPLAAAGYEVIVPDLRGSAKPTSRPTALRHRSYSRESTRSVQDVLGHERCGVVGGDVGGVVDHDSGLRFPGFVEPHASSTRCRRS